MKSLSRLLSRQRIVWLASQTKEDALRTMIEAIATSIDIPSIGDVHRAILERESLVSTGLGNGLAIPHAKLPDIADFTVGLGIHQTGLEFDSIDDSPVHILVMILGPNSKQELYLQVLSRVTHFLKDNRDRLLELEDPAEIYQLTLDY